MALRPAIKRDSPPLAIRQVHSDVHLIAHDVFIPLLEAERAETEKALAIVGRLRDRALQAMKDQDVDLADAKEDKVIFAFDYRIENGHAVVQVDQVAE